MAPRESMEMKAARAFVINEGKNANEASKLSGISRSAIYMSLWYKKFKKEKNGTKHS